jgi:hypothetical protein
MVSRSRIYAIVYEANDAGNPTDAEAAPAFR